jgi:hypothetical protein
MPRPRSLAVWSEHWRSVEERLQATETRVRVTGAAVIRGGDFDRWDLEVRGGPLGAARLRTAVEEHGGGRQLTRFRVWPRLSPSAIVTTLFVGALAIAAAAAGAWLAAAILGLIGAVLVTRELQECATGIATVTEAIDQSRPEARRASRRAAPQAQGEHA